MEKYIHVTKEVRLELARVFNVSDRTVRNALRFDKERGETDCARRIRKYALLKGGVVMAVVPEVEVMYDHDGMISQYFPNGAKLETDKSTGDTELYFKGECVASWEDVKMSEMDGIQRIAGSLNAENAATLRTLVEETEEEAVAKEDTKEEEEAEVEAETKAETKAEAVSE